MTAIILATAYTSQWILIDFSPPMHHNTRLFLVLQIPHRNYSNRRIRFAPLVPTPVQSNSFEPTTFCAANENANDTTKWRRRHCVDTTASQQSSQPRTSSWAIWLRAYINIHDDRQAAVRSRSAKLKNVNGGGGELNMEICVLLN